MRSQLGPVIRDQHVTVAFPQASASRVAEEPPLDIHRSLTSCRVVKAEAILIGLRRNRTVRNTLRVRCCAQDCRLSP